MYEKISSIQCSHYGHQDCWIAYKSVTWAFGQDFGTKDPQNFFFFFIFQQIACRQNRI